MKILHARGKDNLSEKEARSAAAGLARQQAESIEQGTRTDLISLSNNEFRQGTDQSYLLRRLARSHPEILDAYERDEYKSVRAAALAAGIVKPSFQFRVSWDTPTYSANLHRRHLSQSQRAQCAADVAKMRLGDNQHNKSEGKQVCLPSIDDAAKIFRDILHIFWRCGG